MNMEYKNPIRLVEPGTKYFFNETLKMCKKSKSMYYNNIYNISLFVMFFSILGITLYYNYNSKTYKKKNEKINNEKKQEYILSLVAKMNKINKEKQIQNNINNNLITNLPCFETQTELTTKTFL